MAGAAVLLVAGCETATTGGPSGRPDGRQDRAPTLKSITLAPGDVLRLFYPGAPELNHTQKIRADGKISLPAVGEVRAAGKELGRLQSDLTALYKPQLQNNEVVVTLESGGAPVLVSGAVQKPGRLLLDKPTTVLEAIMEAGGATVAGNLKKVHVIRVSDGEHRTEILNLRPALSGRVSPAYYVKAGDVIYVPEKLW